MTQLTNVNALLKAFDTLKAFEGLEDWIDEDKVLSSQSFSSPKIEHPELVDLLCDIEADLPDLVLAHGYVILPDVSKRLVKHNMTIERRDTGDVAEYSFVLKTPEFSIYF